MSLLDPPPRIPLMIFSHALCFCSLILFSFSVCLLAASCIFIAGDHSRDQAANTDVVDDDILALALVVLYSGCPRWLLLKRMQKQASVGNTTGGGTSKHKLRVEVPANKEKLMITKENKRQQHKTRRCKHNDSKIKYVTIRSEGKPQQ